MIKRLLNPHTLLKITLILTTLLLIPTSSWATSFLTVDNPIDFSQNPYKWSCGGSIYWSITTSNASLSQSNAKKLNATINNEGSITLTIDRPVDNTCKLTQIILEGTGSNCSIKFNFQGSNEQVLDRNDAVGHWIYNKTLDWPEDQNSVAQPLIVTISSQDGNNSASCDISNITFDFQERSDAHFQWPAKPTPENETSGLNRTETNGVKLEGHCLQNTVFSFPLEETTGSSVNITYESSNPEVATVDEQTGQVTIKTTGETTITATIEDTSSYFFEPASYSYTLNITGLDEDYGLSVGGVAITSVNASDVLGDGNGGVGSVSFDGVNTLTLNNTSITMQQENPAIFYRGGSVLNIKLKGSNTINSGNCSAIRGSGTLSFIIADSQPCSLIMETTESSVIDGFTETKYDGFYMINDVILGSDAPNTYKMTITSTLLGGGNGTAETPFLIKEPTDLINFAKYINNQTINSNVSVQLFNNIDCQGLQGFEPIGNYSIRFSGTFDGNGKKISSLSANNVQLDAVGLFATLASGAKIENLTLDYCTFNGGNSSSNDIGSLVGCMNGGEINNCTIQNSTISCLQNAQNPTTGGIVGSLIAGSINNCVVQDCTIKSETSDSSASGANAKAGGVVGTFTGGSISGCQVKGTTMVSADYGHYSAELKAGAIIALNSAGSLSDNTYEYTVTTSTNDYNLDTQTTTLTIKSSYDQRGTGTERLVSGKSNYDVFENDGAVLANTKKLTLPASQENTGFINLTSGYYKMEEGNYYVAANQNVEILVTPRGTNAIGSFTATSNNTTIETTSRSTSDGTIYSFTMPSSDVTVAVNFAIDIANNQFTSATIEDAAYDGTEQVPTTVTLTSQEGGKIYLTNNSDGTQFIIKSYILDGETVSSPINVGTYTVTIEGTGDYAGTREVQYTITKGDAGLYFYHIVNNEEDQVLAVEEATYGTVYDAPLLKNPHNLSITFRCTADNTKNGEASDVATIDNEGKLTILKGGTVYVYAITTGNDNYEGTDVHYQLNVEKGNLSSVTIAEIEDQTYTGSAIKPTVTVTLNGKAVSTDDYDIAYSDNINVSTDANKATITLTAKSTSEHFTEGTTKTATFNIVAKSITDDMIQAIADQTYSFGNAITPTVTVKDGETTLTLATTADDTGDYSVAYSNNTNAAKSTDDVAPTVTITGKGNYTGTASKTFTINPMAVATATISLSDATLTYNGAAQHPTISSIEGENSEGSTLEFASSDYTVSYEQNDNTLTADDVKNAGGYTLVAIFGGNYSGTATTTFNIAAKDLSDAATIATIPDQTYTGNEIKPEPAVSIVLIDGNDATTLTKGTDFDYSYANNINASEQAEVQPTVTITGKGNYTGSASQTFSITNATMTVTATGYNGTYDGNAHGITVAAPEGATVTYGTKKGTYDKTVSPTYTDAGSYMVHYQVERTNYATITDSAKVEITKATPSITFDKESYSATYGETFTAPTASTNPEGLTVTATSSSNTQVATISDGVITIVGVGETTITVSFAGSNNYEATTATYKLNVAAGTIIGVTATGYSDVYDGKAHGITVTAPEGATIKYGTKKGTYNLDQSPTYSDAGTYMVHYQVECTNYTTLIDSVKVEITKANITPNITLEGWAYGTTENTPVVTGNTGNGTETFTYKAEGSDAFTSEVPTAVGTHTVKVTIGETTNYNGGEATTTFAITNRTIDPVKDITFAEGQSYASFYSANEDLVLPESGIAVYMITGIEGNTLITQAVSYIPNGVPVLIEKTETAVEAKDPSEVGTNMLQYATEDVAASGTLYILYNGEYVKATGTIPQGKCYLKLNKPSGARILTIGNNNGTTSISNFNADTETDRWFDLNGQRISKPQKKGLYIKNGKKIVVK